MINVKELVNNHLFLLINILLFYFFHIYTFFTYFLFYIFIKNNKNNNPVINQNENINFDEDKLNNIEENESNEIDTNENNNNITSRDVKQKDIKLKKYKQMNQKKNISENTNSKEIKSININPEKIIQKEICNISSKNINTKFFVLVIYLTTIYYGYIFICNLIFKLFLIGFLYIIYKNYNGKYLNNIFEILNTYTNDKYKPYVNYLNTICNIIFTKITSLQNYIDELNLNDEMKNNQSLIYYKTIVTIFDYIYDKLIYNDYNIFYKILLCN